MVVVRCNTALADAYALEFFRTFEHMRFRNEVGNRQGRTREGFVPLRQACEENRGRAFTSCSKPRGESCGLFAWLDARFPPAELASARWPQSCFDGSSFECLQRRA